MLILPNISYFMHVIKKIEGGGGVGVTDISLPPVNAEPL